MTVSFIYCTAWEHNIVEALHFLRVVDWVGSALFKGDAGAVCGCKIIYEFQYPHVFISFSIHTLMLGCEVQLAFLKPNW